MKIVCLFLTIFCALTFCDETTLSQEERDLRIKQLQEEIQIHTERALYADREAQRLMPLDFLSYRRYLIMRDKNMEEVTALREELVLLQKQHK
jgi:hypothetical protein